MAQLNDLIVLGNSNLVGETNINGNLNINSDVTIKNTLSVEGTTYLKNNIELTRTSNANNPYLKLTSSSGSSYLQLVGTSIGLGNGWENSLKIDNAGNATLSGSMTAGGTTIALGASANIIGTTKQATTISNQLVLQKGAVFSGTAANAGLVTRGICGVSTPDSNGACSKDNLYINYDSTNDYNASRQLVLQAGSVGTHYGSNLYQYAAARGDAVKGWVEAQGYAKLNSEDIASNSVKAMFGLNGNAKPNDIFKKLGQYNQHWWSVNKEIDRIIYKKTQIPITTDSTLIYDYIYEHDTICYSTDIKIDQQLKDVILINRQKLDIDISTKNNVENAINSIIALAPIYIKFSNKSNIYYIPSGASLGKTDAYTFYYDTNDSGDFRIYASSSAPIKIEKVDIIEDIKWQDETLYQKSSNSNTYPDLSFIYSYKEKLADTEQLQIAYNNSLSITYGEECSYDGTTLSIINPKNIILQASVDDYKYSLLQGSFINFNNEIKYIRNGSTMFIENNGNNCTLNILNVKTIEGCKNYNATTDKFYEYIGIPFNNIINITKIDIGHYIGTGTYGKLYPNSLTFNFAPRILIILKNNVVLPTWFFKNKNETQTVKSDISGGFAKVIFNGNTVTWYSDENDAWWDDGWSSAIGDSDSARQLNENGVLYRYIAIN